MTVQNANHDKPARSPGIIYCSLVHPRSEGENAEGGESSASRTRGAAGPRSPRSLPFSPHPAVLQATASLNLRFLSCRRTPGTPGTPFSAERGGWRQETETRTQETTPRGAGSCDARGLPQALSASRGHATQRDSGANSRLQHTHPDRGRTAGFLTGARKPRKRVATLLRGGLCVNEGCVGGEEGYWGGQETRSEEPAKKVDHPDWFPTLIAESKDSQSPHWILDACVDWLPHSWGPGTNCVPFIVVRSVSAANPE